MEQQIRFCTTSDGVRIAYATVGQGYPLVKAANWLNHLEFDWESPIWGHLMRGLAENRLLVRYDERGTGLSDRQIEDTSSERWVGDLGSVVDAAGLDRFALLGISQGGPVAIAYAIQNPERVSHLILYGTYARSPRPETPEEVEAARALLILMRQGWGQDNPAYRHIFTSRFIPDGTAEQMRWFADVERKSASPEMAVKLLIEFARVDVTEIASRISTPTLILHCRDDQACPFSAGRELAALVPGARFVPMEGSNHLFLEDEPAREVFLREVNAFLLEGEAATAAAAPSCLVTILFTFPQEGIDFSEEHLPGRLAFQEQMVASFHRDEARSGDERGQLASRGERAGLVVAAMQYQRGHPDSRGYLCDVYTRKLGQELDGHFG